MGRKSPSNTLKLQGKSFGKLTVLERAGKNTKHLKEVRYDYQ